MIFNILINLFLSKFHSFNFLCRKNFISDAGCSRFGVLKIASVLIERILSINIIIFI